MNKSFSTILSILSIAITMLLTSCLLKHEDQSQYRDQLPGKWKLTYERQETDYGEVTSINGDWWIGTSFTFSEDGKLVICSKEGDITNETWSLDTDGITIHNYSAGIHFKGKITKLTKSTLEMNLVCTSDGYTGYIDIQWKFDRIN